MVGFSSENWFTDSGFYPYEIGQSCRFNRAQSSFMSRAPSSAGNKKTFTWSGWVKFCNSASYRLFGSGTATDEVTDFHMDGTDGNLRFRDRSGDNLRKETTAKLRDVGAWYHIVCAVDVTQASNSNRVKIYINGTLQTSFSQDDTFVNRNTYINRTGGNGMVLGKRSFDDASLLDGYMAEVHFIDGTQLTADTFGETKEGVWIPKAVTGVTYGTNGFYLKFDQTGTGTASASTIGADSSGNTNHFTSSGLASTDSNLPDSPTNNFAVMSPIDKQSQVTLTEGNLKVRTSTTGGGYKVRGTMQLSGKVYFEGLIGAVGGDIGSWFGIADNSDGITDFNSSRRNGFYYNASDMRKAVDGSFSVISSGAVSANDIIGLAYNFDDNEFSIYRNNSAVLTDATFTNDVGFSPIADLYRNDSTDTGFIFNFGQDSSFAGAKTAQNNSDQNGHGDFYYSPPSGYLALCTANLPEPTISPLNGDQPSDYFNSLLFDGTGSSPTSFTGVGFQPDLLWIKRRDNASNGHHIWYDAIRGGTNALRSSTTGAEAQFGDTVITAFGADGFTIQGTDGPNASGYNNVAWNWLGANGTTTNDASATSVGSIDSVYSANTTAGFSIVSYTGTGSAATVAHGLGAVPKAMIIKNRDTASTSWIVYHESIGATKCLFLEETSAVATTSATFNNTAPTSSVFTVNTSNSINKSGDDLIAYCFAEVEGYSKIGSYSGNQDADGVFVYTGFRPSFVLGKSSSSSGDNWYIFDNKRDPINSVGKDLNPDDYAAEATSTYMDFVSNGIKFRSSSGLVNDSTTFIYMAFAEMPFKYANAR